MLKNYRILLAKRCFRFVDAVLLFGGTKKASNILHNLKGQGLIEGIRKNLYVAISLDTMEPVASPFEIATLIAGDNGAVSHHSAFEYYGLANQVYSDVFVLSDKKSEIVMFDGKEYKCLKRDCSFGIVKKGKVSVCDLERTVLDSIKEFEKISGLEELLRCLDMVSYLDEVKLMKYLQCYDSKILYQKTGYLLGVFPRLHLSERFFDYCKNRIGSSVRYLYEDLKLESYKYDKKWQLCVPDKMLDLLGEGSYV